MISTFLTGVAIYGCRDERADPDDNTRFIVHASRVAPDATRWNIGVFDLNEQKEVVTFHVDDPDAQELLTLSPSPQYIFVNQRQRIVRFDIDGSDEMTFYEPVADRNGEIPTVSSAALSPNGSRLAVIDWPIDHCDTTAPSCLPYSGSRLIVLDSATGDPLLTVDQRDTRLDQFHGHIVHVTWRDDGMALIIQGSIDIDHTGSRAMITMDGHITDVPTSEFFWVSPNGRYIAGGESKGCNHESPREQHELVVKSINTGSELVRMSDPIENFVHEGWSPRGDEVLYRTYRLQPNRDDGSCPQLEPGSETWRILTVADGMSREVRDRFDAQEQWYGEAHVTSTCLGERLIDPGWACVDDSQEPAPIDVWLDGQPLVTGYDVLLLRVPALYEPS